MKMIAAALCALLVSACTTKGGAKTTMATGGGIMVGGVVLGAALIRSEEGEDEMTGLLLGEAVVVAGGALLFGGFLNYLILDGNEPSTKERVAEVARPRLPTFRCDVLEISAARGDAPSVDAALAPLQRKLAQPPFSSWNQFRLVAQTEATLTGASGPAIALAMGAVSATVDQVGGPSMLRISAELEDQLRQRHRYRPADVGTGEAALYGPIDLGLEPHVLGLICR